MEKFSVVIHTFNRIEILPDTLKAVREQELSPHEIIVVDDGSSDGTEAFIRREFPEVRLLRINNSGCGAARKAGADVASGDWIAFCDDDDLWLPNHLARRAKLISRFPEAEFTFSNFRAFGPNANSNYVHFSCAPEGWWDGAVEARDGNFIILDKHVYRNFLAFNPAYPSTWSIKHDAYHRLGGINARYSRMQAEDTEFLRRCAANLVFAGDFEVTAMYRRHGNNLSANKWRNYSARAEIVEQQMQSQIVPEECIAQAMKFVKESRKTAYLEAFWARDREGMAKVFNAYVEVRRDPRLLLRHMVAMLERK